MNKRVSVLIPCYNGEKTIDRAIESVYIQNYSCTELIVVDDGSTDSSKEKILAWKERFQNAESTLIYVYQENKGPGGAINTGLKYVTGKYLTLLDADDEYLVASISKKAEYLDSHSECDVVRSNGWVVRGTHRHLFVYEEAEKRCEDVFLALLSGETNNWAGSYMVRTEALFNFYPQREIYASRYGQNLQLLLPLAYKKPVGFLDEPLMNYIQLAESLSHTADASMAKKRELENAAGYRDIRVYMLDLIVKDIPEKQSFLRKIDGAHWRRIMSIADAYGDNDLLREAYTKLRNVEEETVNDKILFFRRIAPPVAFLFRGINKLKRATGGNDDSIS